MILDPFVSILFNGKYAIHIVFYTTEKKRITKTIQVKKTIIETPLPPSIDALPEKQTSKPVAKSEMECIQPEPNFSIKSKRV